MGSEDARERNDGSAPEDEDGDQSGDAPAPTTEPEDDIAPTVVATIQGEPDVFLHVPTLRVGEIDLKVSELRAHVALHAAVADLVTLDAGTDVSVGKVELQLKDVEAQAVLKVRLQEVYKIVERSLATIDRNPQVIERRVHDAISEAARPPLTLPTDRAADEPAPAAVEVETEKVIPVEADTTTFDEARQPRKEGPSDASRPPQATPASGRPRRSLTARALSRAVRTPRALLRRAREVADILKPGDGR